MNLIAINEIIEKIGISSIDAIEYRSGAFLKDKYTLFHSSDAHTFYEFTGDPDLIVHARNLIIASLLDQSEMFFLVKEDDQWSQIPFQLIEKTILVQIPESFYLYIPPQKKSGDIKTFLELIAHLRAPEGCPWDRKQTHESLRTNLLEETYEVLEAIDTNSPEALKEELGDLLLQIVLHAQISRESGDFTFNQVVNDVHLKIKHRHPHVFAQEVVEGVSGVMRNWEKIKEEERAEKPTKNGDSILASIPGQLPALSIAQKYQERASRVGFDWDDISPVFEKIVEEIEEVKKADPENGLEDELGDLLFAVVNLVRWSGFDAENALRLTNKKFRRRFNFIEKKISESGRSIAGVSLSEMDALWNTAKRGEH